MRRSAPRTPGVLTEIARASVIYENHSRRTGVIENSCKSLPPVIQSASGRHARARHSVPVKDRQKPVTSSSERSCMRRFTNALLIVVLVFTFCAPTLGLQRSQHVRRRATHTRQHRRVPARAGRYYTNVDGDRVPSPVRSRSVPAGASARCGDGTYSFSRHRGGTCSHHGGVAEWLN